MMIGQTERIFPKYLETAIATARANDSYPKWRLGAVIMKGGNVMALGMNRLHTPAVLVEDDLLHKVSTHAEIDALKRAGNVNGADIYVARIGRSGRIGKAKPCSSCVRELKLAGIKRAFWTEDGTSWGTTKI